MKKQRNHRTWLMATMLVMASLLAGSCTADEEPGGGDKPVQLVMTRLHFSLPSRIAGKKAQPTRMSDEVVQASGDEAGFRGIDDVRLFCFDEYPTRASENIGNVIEMRTQSKSVVDSMITEDDYSLSKEIDIPVGTSYFGFYANAEEEPLPQMSLHERRMHYGVIETIGLDKQSYQGNSGIRFRPVPICTSGDNLGGSATGQALLNLLNLLMNIRVNDDAPNNLWATANNLYLDEAYQRMTTLTTLSSNNVQTMLGAVLRTVNQEAPDDQGSKLAAAITEVIEENCGEAPDIANGIITLKAVYQGFPADIHLPEGAARIAWNADKNRFEPAEHNYGKALSVPSVNDYVYPINLQYQVFSDIVVSDTLVINEVTDDGEVAPRDSTRFKDWGELIRDGYKGASKQVEETTRSVAMVKQVEYAVGRLALRARITRDDVFDAKGKPVDVSAGFTLKGYVVGGQREVDYNFQPVEDSKVYAIYDTDLNEGTTSVTRRVFDDENDKYDYILGLGTPRDKSIYLAMELVNNGPAFQGADGLIAHGGTFYLVADLDPSLGANYATGSIDQIFIKDRYTKVNLKIAGGYRDKDGDGKPDPDLDEHGQPKPVNGLATATYGLPDLEVPHPTVGLSVDLSWGDGLWFEDVVL